MPPTAAIATPHPHATRAARLALEQGGNAIDAAAAALLTLCVVMPQQVGLGGYGGSLIFYKRASSPQIVCLDFDTVAPRGFKREFYPDEKSTLHGALAVSVPAVIAGLARAVEDHGTLPFSAACTYAADLADSGFPITAADQAQILQWSTRTDPLSRRALFKSDLPNAGDPWVQKDKAALLRRLAAEGAQAFYHGDIPRHIRAQLRSMGGVLSEQDFADYQPRYVHPLRITYRNHEILTPPPPSGGLTTLQILKLLEQFDLTRIEPFSADYFHLLAESIKLSWHDRHATAGDPDFVDMPIERLLSTQYAAEQAARLRAKSLANFPIHPPTSPHTANICITDHHGNLVSLTATQGYLFGSQVVVEGLGIVLNHGMSRFDYSNPSSPNAPAPLKRPFHNMAPTIVLAAGQPRFAVGLPGGPKIVTVTAQLLVNLIDFRLSPHDAIHAPRIHLETADPIAVSSRVSDSTLRALQHLGHTTVRGQTVGGPPNEIAGNANALSLPPNQPPQAASQVDRASLAF